MTFIPLREPTSVPSGHLLPLEGGERPLHRLLIQMAFDTRMPLPRIRHFERKREIFFVRGKAKDVRGAGNGKPSAPCAPEERCFMQTAPHRKRNTANEKDPSAPLGMTIRECRFARIRHFERKRDIFFVRGKAKDVRGTASGKHRTPCTPKKRCFIQTVPHRKRNTANEKDPSAPLGITIREYYLLKKGG